MTAARQHRWLMSFADLCLLLLGFFVLLHARADGPAAAASVRAAFGGGKGAARPGLDLPAADLFEAREAVLRPAAAKGLAIFARTLANGRGRVRVSAHGSDGTGARFDGWELGAARAAAVARGISRGGVAPDRIDIVLPQGPDRQGRARITVE